MCMYVIICPEYLVQKSVKNHCGTVCRWSADHRDLYGADSVLMHCRYIIESRISKWHLLDFSIHDLRFKVSSVSNYKVSLIPCWVVPYVFTDKFLDIGKLFVPQRIYPYNPLSASEMAPNKITNAVLYWETILYFRICLPRQFGDNFKIDMYVDQGTCVDR